MKRILITSTDLMMVQFLIPHVRHLREKGFQVELACSDVGGRLDDVRSALSSYTNAIHTVRLKRSPFAPGNIAGYRDLRKLLSENLYDLIWTNEPVMSVATRLAARDCRRQGTKVLYMCHGFHFFKGAPILNWLLFYPIERLLSRFCDGIVTMNQEDFEAASSFRGPEVFKIPGVGVDMTRFRRIASPDAAAKRRELGIPEDACLLLSVGELTRRKNHRVVLRALHVLKNPNIHYMICGVGRLEPRLKRLVKVLELTDRVHFPGYRMDIPEILRCADCFVFPSVQEGLPFALMEAMSCGLPIVCSRIRGNTDLIDDPEGGILCSPSDPYAYRDALLSLPSLDISAMAEYNRKKLSGFCLEHTKLLITDLFISILS